MNNRLFYLVFALSLFCFSCGNQRKDGSESSKNILEQLEVTLDTLQVDVGDEIFIAGAYQEGQPSSDGKRIFFEYSENQEIHEIDLDELRLLGRHPLAKDGPNQAPKYVQGFQLLDDKELFMFSQVGAGIYQLNGEKQASIPYQLSEIPGLEELEGINFFPHVWLSPDRKTLMAIPFKHGASFFTLAVVDLTSQTGKMHLLPALDITKDYQVTQEQNDMTITAGDNVSTFMLNNQLAIGSSSTADFYLFDWEKDSLQLIESAPKALPKQKTGAIRNRVESQEERWEVSRQLGKMINYRDMYFDPSRQLYFRFASQHAKHDEQGKFLSYEVWLLSYDLEFNLTGEQQIKELKVAPSNGFFKEGKLYSYTVLEEDPGFAVIDLKF